MTSPDLDRIRFITRNFNDLTGMHFAGTSLMMLSIGVAPYARSASSRFALPILCVRTALLVLGFVLTLYARTYYKKRFGEVQPLGEPIPEALSIYRSVTAPRVRYAKKFDVWIFLRMLLIWWSCFIVYLTLKKISPAVDVPMPSTVVLPEFAIVPHLIAITFASVFLSSWISRGYRLSQAYYLVLGLVMLGIPALGASMGFTLRAVQSHPELNLNVDRLLTTAYNLEPTALICGVCLLVAALLDHWQLVRAFKPAVKEFSL